MKVLMTGGHVTPALAVIDEIKDKHPQTKIIFVGRKFATTADKKTTLEYEEVIKRNVPFFPFVGGRLTRAFDLSALINIGKIPFGLFKAFQILHTQKPDIILSFGGYIALPIAVAGKALSIPIFTHEQTIEPGLANKIIAGFAKKVFISFPESAKSFPAQKVLVTGNPLRHEIFIEIERPFSIPSGKKVIYITGGSLGAHSVNLHIEKMLPQLLEKYVVIHQTGNVQEYADYERLNTLRASFPEELKKNYFIKSHFLTEQVGYIYKHTDLVVGRSGANTFFEMVALKKPTIFIPLPWSARGEQQKHAQLYKKHRVGEIFDQSGSSSELLLMIDKMIANLGEYKKNFDQFPTYYTQHAAQKISDYIHQN